jgi:acyl-CoA synthetase (AMP-forming)/AMP-acid ligase II
MLTTGGENVFPIEVEQVIAALDAVVEVGVVSAPIEAWVEAVAAYLVTKSSPSRVVRSMPMMSSHTAEPTWPATRSHGKCASSKAGRLGAVQATPRGRPSRA